MGKSPTVARLLTVLLYQSQETAYEQTYRRVVADYQAAYDNAFQAKLVGPRDLPKVAPTLDEAISTYC